MRIKKNRDTRKHMPAAHFLDSKNWRKKKKDELLAILPSKAAAFARTRLPTKALEMAKRISNPQASECLTELQITLILGHVRCSIVIAVVVSSLGYIRIPWAIITANKVAPTDAFLWIFFLLSYRSYGAAFAHAYPDPWLPDAAERLMLIQLWRWLHIHRIRFDFLPGGETRTPIYCHSRCDLASLPDFPFFFACLPVERTLLSFLLR